MNWTISVPVWGPWHTELFLKYALPSHLRMGLEGCKYIIHSDGESLVEIPQELRNVCEVEIRPIRSSRSVHHKYRCMNECHGEAMKEAGAVMFLPPDCVVSSNTRKVIEASGKKLVMACSLRTLNGGEPPRDPEALNAWAAKHLHPNQRGWVWGNEWGTELIHSHVYFEDGENFWCHGFHLHPLAAVLDRKYGSGKSVDSYLPSYYDPRETWVVSDCELAMAELSPADIFFGLERGPETVSSIVDSVKGKIKDRHLGFFKTAIRLRGQVGQTDIPGQILKGLA